MMTCSRCGRNNPDWATFCVGCANRLTPEMPEARVAEEIRHIDYLLAEIPTWPARRWITPAEAALLLREYRDRRERLMRPAEAPAPPVVHPSVPAETAPERPATSAASPAPVAPVPAPPAAQAQQAPWLAEFLEAHWVKLLAALAAVLIFVGMRQILGWEWVSRLALFAVPLLPVGLTAMFYYYGMRDPADRSPGVFAYRAVAVVMVAFSLFSINKHWFGNRMLQRESVLVGIILSEALAAWTLRKTRDPNFLHLVLGGCGAAVFALLQVMKPSPLLEPAPVWLYGSAFLALAAVYLLSAFRLRETAAPDTPGAQAVPVMMLWAHLLVTVTLFRITLPIALGAQSPGEATALMAAAAALYVLSAQVFRNTAMAYAAAAMASGSAVLFMRSAELGGWYAWGHVALTLSAFGLGMSALNRFQRTTEKEDGASASIAEAYRQLALLGGLLAGGALIGRIAQAALGGGALTGADWPSGVWLSGLCTGLYVGFALFNRRPEYLYAAAATAAFALTLATHRLLPEIGPFAPRSLAHDLFPFVLLASTAGLLIQKAESRRQKAESSFQPFAFSIQKKADWSAPLLEVAALAVGLGLLIALMQGLETGATPGLWSTLVPYGLLCLWVAVNLGEGFPPRHRFKGLGEPPVEFAQGWFVGAMLAATACAGFLAAAEAPVFLQTRALPAGMALVVIAWVWYGLALVLRRHSPENLFIEPLIVGAAVTALCGALLTTGGRAVTAPWMLATFALALLLPAVAAVMEREANYIALSFGLALLGAMRLTVAAAEPAMAGKYVGALTVAYLLGAAALYAVVPRRLGNANLLWLSVIAVGLSGIEGWLFGDKANLAEQITLSLAAAGMAAGAVGFGFVARREQRADFTYAAGGFALAAYVYTLTLLVTVRAEGFALWLLPALLGLVALAQVLAKTDDALFRVPLERVAVSGAVLAIGWAFLVGLSNPTATSWHVTGTLAAYGAASLLGVIYRQKPHWVATSTILFTLAYGYRFATIDLSTPQWAAAVACAGAFWLVAARAVHLRVKEELAAPLYGLATYIAALAGVVGLLTAGTPNQGMFSLIALAIAGSVFSGLFLLGRGGGYAHAGFAAYLCAYGLFLYDRVNMNLGVLDLYLIPLGLYLVVLGHITGNRGQAENAAALWWLGLLVVLSPTFLAFYVNHTQGGTPLHGLLLLLESFGAVGWGIANRIQAFVFSGALFVLAYAMVLGGGAVVEIWSGLFAVALGVLLLVFVFYITLHQDTLRKWMGRIGDEWRQWR